MAKPGAEPLRQAVAGEKDVPRLGQPVLERVVRVGEAARDRHGAAPIEVAALVRHRRSVLAWSRAEYRGVPTDDNGDGARRGRVRPDAWRGAASALGARVRVVDPAGPAAGASGGVVGALTPFAPDPWSPLKALQLASLQATEAFWAEVDAVSGLASGYGQLPRVMPLADDAAVARARALGAAAERRWRGAGAWRVEPADDWAPSPTGLAAVDTLAARLHPRRATQSLAEALRRRGVEIVAQSPRRGRRGLGHRARGPRRARPRPRRQGAGRDARPRRRRPPADPGRGHLRHAARERHRRHRLDRRVDVGGRRPRRPPRRGDRRRPRRLPGAGRGAGARALGRDPPARRHPPARPRARSRTGPGTTSPTAPSRSASASRSRSAGWSPRWSSRGATTSPRRSGLRPPQTVPRRHGREEGDWGCWAT